MMARPYQSTYCLFGVIDFDEVHPAAITIKAPCYSMPAISGDFYFCYGADRGLPQLLSFNFKRGSIYFLGHGVLTHSPCSG